FFSRRSLHTRSKRDWSSVVCSSDLVKNVGAIIRKPFDSIIKSLLVAVYNLKAEQIIVIVHHDCGMSNVDTDDLVKNMKEKGISEETLNAIDYAGIDVHQEFHGFETV